MRKPGDLSVWWIPQVPMKEFEVDVASVEEGVKVMSVLAAYDIFQFENNVKPDFCNAGGLRRWCEDSDGEGTPGWEDWYDEESGDEDPRQWIASNAGSGSAAMEQRDELLSALRWALDQIENNKERIGYQKGSLLDKGIRIRRDLMKKAEAGK